MAIIVSTELPRIKTPGSPITARELLVEIAGEKHALHTVVAIEMSPARNALAFRCDCGALCIAPATEANLLALKNVLTKRSANGAV